MKTDLIQQLSRVRSDGGTRPCPNERLDAIKAEFDQLCTDAGNAVNDRRAMSEDVRLCLWENQSDDGRKHDSDEKKAFPFDGASDSRIRLADGTINERRFPNFARLAAESSWFRNATSVAATTTESVRCAAPAATSITRTH